MSAEAIKAIEVRPGDIFRRDREVDPARQRVEAVEGNAGGVKIRLADGTVHDLDGRHNVERWRPR